MQDYEIVKLGKEDQRIFMDALLNYEVPNDALRSAAEEYLKAELSAKVGDGA